jgi:hypothetical protein
MIQLPAEAVAAAIAGEAVEAGLAVLHHSGATGDMMPLHNQAIATALRVARKMRADGGEVPMTEKQFNRYYSQHIDIRHRKDGQGEDRAKEIAEKGFRRGFAPNVLPTYPGGEPKDRMDDKYGPKKGDYVYLIPKEARREGGNGSYVTEGWKPKPHEMIRPQTDFESSYDGYKRALGAQISRAERAYGGSMTTTTTAMGNHVQKHVGPIKSAVAGRTDHLPMHVPHGAYVIPADIISAMGEGNTAAGFKHMDYIFGGTPYEGGSKPYNQPSTPYGANMPTGHAAGGSAGTVPIVAAGGEYVLSPEQVMRAGNGDLDMGHRVLDEFVKRKRAETIKTLKALPGPRKD